MQAEPEEEQRIPPKKARQGGSSKRILVVLVSSLVLALILWGLVEIYYSLAVAPENPLSNADIPDTTDPNPIEPDGTR